MKWYSLATSLRMSALGFNCGKGQAYSEPVGLRDQFTGRKRPKDFDRPQLENQNHEYDPEVPARSAGDQTDSSIMAKLLRIAKTKDVPPGQAAGVHDGRPENSPLQYGGNLVCHRRHLHAPWRAAVGRRRSRHQGHLSVARCGFRPENRRCFGAASAEWRSKLQSRGRRR